MHEGRWSTLVRASSRPFRGCRLKSSATVDYSSDEEVSSAGGTDIDGDDPDYVVGQKNEEASEDVEVIIRRFCSRTYPSRKKRFRVMWDESSEGAECFLKVADHVSLAEAMVEMPIGGEDSPSDEEDWMFDASDFFHFDGMTEGGEEVSAWVSREDFLTSFEGVEPIENVEDHGEEHVEEHMQYKSALNNVLEYLSRPADPMTFGEYELDPETPPARSPLFANPPMHIS